MGFGAILAKPKVFNFHVMAIWCSELLTLIRRLSVELWTDTRARGNGGRCRSSMLDLCSDYELWFHFNATADRCEQFWWGGCEDGNGNRFITLADCERRCRQQTAIRRPPTEQHDGIAYVHNNHCETWAVQRHAYPRQQHATLTFDLLTQGSMCAERLPCTV